VAATASTRLVTDKHLAGTERMAVDAFGGRFYCPAAATGLTQVADHGLRVDRGDDLPRPVVS